MGGGVINQTSLGWDHHSILLTNGYAMNHYIKELCEFHYTQILPHTILLLLFIIKYLPALFLSLSRSRKKMMDMESCVPPGFRFHPTEEELVGYYLKRKMDDLKIDLDVIIEVDLYKIEPWDIQDRCKLGYDEQNEWYFFSHKDRKYPTGTRTNRATAAGFWKATGRDKAVLSKEKIIGMRKTLVFYKGRAPNGRKTDWIMHEYRLQTSDHGPPQEEGWVVCRAFKKPNPSHKQGYEAWNYMRSSMGGYRPQSYPNMPNFDPNQNLDGHMPKLDSPSISTTSFATNNDSGFTNEEDIKSNFGSSFDYKLLGSSHQLMGTASFDYTNMPLIAHGDYLDDQTHLSNLLQCFPDL